MTASSLARTGGEIDREHIPYGSLLRAAGKYLDGAAGTTIRVLEVPNGFSLQYRQTPDDPALLARTVSYGELLHDKLKPVPVHKRGLFAWKELRAAHAYEPFLTTLGTLLEAAGAFSILLDELDDGFFLTYQYVSPTTGFMLHKRHRILKRDPAAIHLPPP